MADNKVLKGINFPGLEGTYYIPEAKAVKDENGYIEIQSYVSDTVEVENLDTTLTKEGYAADAKAVGNALSGKVGTKDIIGVAYGGTGAGTVTQALENLGITAALAGKAPVGLVSLHMMANSMSIDETLNEFVDGMEDHTTKFFSVTMQGYASDITWWPYGTYLMRVYRYNEYLAHVTAWNINDNTVLYKKASAKFADGVNTRSWSEWEWENPPMIVGQEYRTTKRYEGKPVYAKYIDCGAMPAGSSSGPMTAQVETGVDHLKVTNWYIYATSGDELCNFPMISSGEIVADAWLSHSLLYLRSWRDYSNYHAHTIIEYIK